ncbi:MAG TPA: Rieske (2Fe-2S) protein [Gemmatimonadales bacterium]|jgi:nitrite reductase/ring-hydroxylating ferredoxin subunit|nr:Rieske (2Fe-2S) protein [Gemmatimonadales bacterium]
MMRRDSSSSTSCCSDCDETGGRRAFLRELAAIAAGVAAALEIRPERAAAWSVGFATGRTAFRDAVSYAIPSQDGVTIDKDREVILVRYQQAVYGFSLSCPHQKTPLRWQEDEHHFKCPKHKSRFEPDGTFIDGKATRNMDRYAIQRQGNDVVVDLGKLYREDENREGWIAAVVRL